MPVHARARLNDGASSYSITRSSSSMASLGADPPGGGGGGGEDPSYPGGDPPRTPRLKLKDEAEGPLSPDTEEHVAEQTDGVFRNFVYQMYTRAQSQQDADDTPNMPELTAFPDEPLGWVDIVSSIFGCSFCPGIGVWAKSDLGDGAPGAGYHYLIGQISDCYVKF